MTVCQLIDDLSLRNRAYNFLYSLGANPKTVQTLDLSEAQKLVLLAQSVEVGDTPNSLSDFWIIQRCTQEWRGTELLYEDFPVPEGAMTRDQMITVLDRVNAQYPDEFKGHRLRYSEIAAKVPPHQLRYVTTGRI